MLIIDNVCNMIHDGQDSSGSDVLEESSKNGGILVMHGHDP